MKTLLLARHAKTESRFNLKGDFERRLTISGEQDAKRMGEWLKTKHLKIDWVLSSSAERARQTTELVLAGTGLSDVSVVFKDELYHAAPETFFKLIQSLPDSANNVLIVSHNDGITHFANQLTDARIDYMQPGSVFAVRSNCLHWTSFKDTERTFEFYKQPESDGRWKIGV